MIHARDDYNRIQDPDNLIPEDEPVFLIRAKDILGPSAVQAWVNLARACRVDGAMVEAAEKQAQRMRDYQKQNGSQIPDMPKGA